jgi:dephospho-CoA kinase
MRVAFAGKMQVGKTTAADYLVRRHGFVKYALADPIKEIAIAGFGWDGAKDERGRRLLQEIGTVGRNYDPEVWLVPLAARLEREDPPRVVVDDVRLAREVAFLEPRGFTVVRIDRPIDLVSGRSSVDRKSHETETELDQVRFELTIDNAGTLDELFARLDALVTSLERNVLRRAT